MAVANAEREVRASGPGSKGTACPKGRPEMGRNEASRTHSLLRILLPEQYTAADVSNKETEKQRNA